MQEVNEQYYWFKQNGVTSYTFNEIMTMLHDLLKNGLI